MLFYVVTVFSQLAQEAEVQVLYEANMLTISILMVSISAYVLQSHNYIDIKCLTGVLTLSVSLVY